MTGTPAVSIVMSVRDGERHLAASLDSVLAQTYPDFELVVIDDASRDSSPQILSAYAARDDRVRVQRQEAAGLARSLNRGIAHARAPLIARLDADDVALPERLELQLAYLDSHPRVGLVGGAVEYIDESGRQFAAVQYPIADDAIRRAFAETTPFVHSAVTMRREAFDRAGGYRPAFYAEDLDLWLRIGTEWQLANLPQPVVRYRLHGDQLTARGLERQSLSAFGARLSWRAREAGLPDPFAEIDLVDRRALEAAGASEEEMTAALVRDGVWAAKTMSRAGRDDLGRELFAFAESHARAESGSDELVAYVRRERARRLREQGRPVAALRARAAAALADLGIAGRG
jgi:glycosyltransferase involved in cell wall biosynthesis